MALGAAAVPVAEETDRLLRAEGPYSCGRGEVPWRRLALFVAFCGALYGGVMGLSDARLLQALYSATKVPLLLLAATLVCLPNFYVVNTLLGLRDDFGAACRAVFAAQASLAVALAAFAPLTLTAYASSGDYDFAIVFNGVAFAVGTVAGQITMQRHYRALVASNPRHRIARFAWAVLYVFVAIQLAWVLRPFVGSPGARTEFFRKDAWSNAYVVVFEKVSDFLTGGY